MCATMTETPSSSSSSRRGFSGARLTAAPAVEPTGSAGPARGTLAGVEPLLVARHDQVSWPTIGFDLNFMAIARFECCD